MDSGAQTWARSSMAQFGVKKKKNPPAFFILSVYKRNTSLMLGFHGKANGDMGRNLKQTRDMTKPNLKGALAAVAVLWGWGGGRLVGIQTNTL